ncbi:MAG: DUF962 domain-containing protein [Candidatus Auribacterota bacterium]|nr:DUF962 domain-containing protein [Candidatus Auribacterota bacterium]
MKTIIEKWVSRHSHPINAILHIIGIPATFIGGGVAFSGYVITGILLFVGGYAIQIIGHKIEGSEVGELMLFKHIGAKLFPTKK